MQKVGLHFNYWNGAGGEKDLYYALDLCSKTGKDLYYALDLCSKTGAEVFEYGTGAILSMATQERAALGRACEKAGMLLTVNGGLPETDLASPDEALRDKSIALTQAAIHAVAETGATIWSGVIYSRWLGMPVEPFTAEARQRM